MGLAIAYNSPRQPDAPIYPPYLRYWVHYRSRILYAPVALATYLHFAIPSPACMTTPFQTLIQLAEPFLPSWGWLVTAATTVGTLVAAYFLLTYHLAKRAWRLKFKGSRISVFEPQLKRLRHAGSLLAVDLVGHGESEVSSEWEPYTTPSLLDDLDEVINQHPGRRLVLIGHSYGSCLAVKLYPRVRDRVAGMVLIAAGDVTHSPHVTRLLRAPEVIIDLFRMLDRYGGTESTSVRRMIYTAGASSALLDQQLYWNESSRTSVFRRTMLGMDWLHTEDLRAVACPLLLLPGEFDPVHPVSCSYAIRECVATKRVTIVVAHQAAHQVMLEKPELTNTEILRFVGEDCGYPELAD
ncbi:hypothetical protein IWQ60_003294 [Tieghemiomyces parasiticus]|uniref:Serine aminopeptidase S33 domain-containing protein n=1 Tax=Tieghemiomyces parasiticus TaxID=78921 RepID=A0A9W8AI50_9FUNG|nr:hypothetical protein IWQ60_003294 [Tieghemiomyces parasiticus]